MGNILVDQYIKRKGPKGGKKRVLSSKLDVQSMYLSFVLRGRGRTSRKILASPLS